MALLCGCGKDGVIKTEIRTVTIIMEVLRIREKCKIKR